MSKQPEEALYAIKFVHRTRHFPITGMELPDACGGVLDYIADLEAEIETLKDLLPAIRAFKDVFLKQPPKDGSPGFGKYEGWEIDWWENYREELRDVSNRLAFDIEEFDCVHEWGDWYAHPNHSSKDTRKCKNCTKYESRLGEEQP